MGGEAERIDNAAGEAIEGIRESWLESGAAFAAPALLIADQRGGEVVDGSMRFTRN